LNGDKFLKRLSNAALETLSIIAYKQPITKGEIEAIRGVNSDYSIQKLLEKELIIISGRNEHLPGRPLVYATSQNFMDYFGINSSGDLPEIKEVLADQIVEATVVKPEDFTDWPVAEETKDNDETVPTDEPLPTEESNIAATQAEADETPQPPAEA
jgi:segregation and condensation protein B